MAKLKKDINEIYPMFEPVKEVVVDKTIAIARMERFWNELHTKGMFKDFKNYQEWCLKVNKS